MAQNSRTGICVYCGEKGVVTKDHVPPKCLFPPEARVNLITVDACPTCHDSYKLDDEYFRVIISIRDDLPAGSETQYLREQTKKTLSNPKAKKFRQSIQASIRRINLASSEESSEFSQFSAMNIDAHRLKSTANRIVRGLYGKFFKTPLPQSYELTVNLFDLQKDMSAVDAPEVQELLMLLVQNGSHHSFGKVLDVWYAKTDDDANSSLWIIRLHGAFGFIGFTLPRSA